MLSLVLHKLRPAQIKLGDLILQSIQKHCRVGQLSSEGANLLLHLQVLEKEVQSACVDRAMMCCILSGRHGWQGGAIIAGEGDASDAVDVDITKRGCNQVPQFGED